MKTKLPVTFITHGSPMLAIEPGQTGILLTKLGKQLSQLNIDAILIISAHWITRTNAIITSGVELETIHDFGGFPKQLYDMQYLAKGSPDIATQIVKTLCKQGIDAKEDPNRGLDHGAWIPLQYMFSNTKLPIMQLSIPWPMDTYLAVKFGMALKPLREQGILIIASGSMTHNLYDAGNEDQPTLGYIKPFVTWVREKIYAHDLDTISHYRELAPYATQAHPTEEHFLPLIIALASTEKDDAITELNAGITYQSLSMDNYIFGTY